MTIGQLREAIKNLDDKMPVHCVVETERGLDFYRIESVDATRGNPDRIDGKACFQFDNKQGITTWALVQIVSEDEP